MRTNQTSQLLTLQQGKLNHLCLRRTFNKWLFSTRKVRVYTIISSLKVNIKSSWFSSISLNLLALFSQGIKLIYRDISGSSQILIRGSRMLKPQNPIRYILLLSKLSKLRCLAELCSFKFLIAFVIFSNCFSDKGRRV